MTRPEFRRVVLLLALSMTGPAAAGSDLLFIPPGGFAWAAMTGDTLPELRTVHTVAPGPWMTSDPLPPAELDRLADGLATDGAAIRWLEGLHALRIRLEDLLHVPIDVGSDAVPFFADIDGDGDSDLLVRDGSGGLHAFVRPGWSEAIEVPPAPLPVAGADLDGDGVPESVTPCGEGSLLFAGGDLPCDTLSGFAFADCAGAALSDMEGDGLADLVVGLHDGRILVYRNRGTSSEPLFVRWSSASETLFPIRPGSYAAPALLPGEDGVPTLAVGTAANGLVLFRGLPGEPGTFPAGWEPVDRLLADERNVSPASPGDASGSILAAVRDGRILRLTPGPDGWARDTVGTIPGTYPVICTFDADGDGISDIVAGTWEGTFHLLRGSGDGSWLPAEPLAGLPAVPGGAPAPWDDGLLAGSREGALSYFVRDEAGAWVDSTAGSVFEGIAPGGCSVPAVFDADGDATPELVVGTDDGRIFCHALRPDGRNGGPLFMETLSWGFEPNSAVSGLDRYYSRYFPEYAELMTPSDTASVAMLLREILTAPAADMDEVAMAIALTPTEILRSMCLEGDADLFRENARCIREAAAVLPYAELAETTGAGGEPSTELRLRTASGWHPVDAGDYYRFVVAPRVLFEIPARVDASYWLEPRDTATVSPEEWLTHEPGDLFAGAGEHLFWRDAVPFDVSYGPSLASSASEASTLEEAILRLCNWQSHSQPDGLMEFGYLTDDLQPLVIYRKAYGSCGEQSILQTAMCRALLIPARVVGCRGEDHQWNEFLDPATGRWTHWDVNYGSTEISHIWVSGEGVDHAGKTISTITAFGPDDSVWETTTSTLGIPGSGYMPGDSGYTPVARVELVVSDVAGAPVEGAMVLARSHWDGRNMVSTVDYTDGTGSCSLELGYEPQGGYTLDVVTPFGSAGFSNLPLVEGCRYAARVSVPGRVPTPQTIEIRGTPGDGGPFRVLSDSLLLLPVSYYTGRLYSLDAPDPLDGEGPSGRPAGARWAPGPTTACDGGVLFMDARNFGAYLAGENCRAVTDPFVPAPGDTCFAVVDNRSRLFGWRRVEMERDPALTAAPLAAVDSAWLSVASPVRDPGWALPVPGPEPGPMAYEPPVTAFSAARILQDDPSDPLSAGWTLGPFTSSGGERSLTVSTTGLTEGLDMDLYLFRDGDGDRELDGMHELLASSTSPTASEELTVADPVPGAVYWIHMLGWSVRDGGGTLDLGLDFVPVALRIRALEPAGPVAETPEEYSFALDPDLSGGERLVASFGQWETVPSRDGDRWVFGRPALAGADVMPEVMLIDASGLPAERARWGFTADPVPPSTGRTELLVDSAAMVLRISVEIADEGSGAAACLVEAQDGVTVPMAAGSDPFWTGTMDLLPFAGSELVLLLAGEDRAGNRTPVDTLRVAVPARPPVMFHAVSPAGVTWDPRPLIQVYPDVESGAPWSASARLENAALGIEVVPEVLVDGPRAAQFRPVLPLEPGEWTATVFVETADGGPESLTWEFTVEAMGSSDS